MLSYCERKGQENKIYYYEEQSEWLKEWDGFHSTGKTFQCERMLKMWCSVDGCRMTYSMKKVTRDQYTYFGNAKRGHQKKRSAAHFTKNKSSIISYDKWYYCELFFLFDPMDPKDLSSLGSLSHRQLDAEKLCKEVSLCPCIVFICAQL